MNSTKLRVISNWLPFAAAVVALLEFSLAAQSQNLPDRGTVADVPTSVQNLSPRGRAATPAPSISPNNMLRALSADAPSNATSLKKVSFLAHYDFPAASLPNLFALGDLNGDSLPDLVIANNGLNVQIVSVLLGNADGSFGAPAFFPTNGNASSAVVIADFNGDGHNDVAVTTLSGVSILLGDGTGKLGPPQGIRFANNATPIDLVAADFNDDHKLDLAVVDAGTNDVTLLLGDGSGGFTPGPTLAVGQTPVAIAVSDFNRDGHPDLVVTDPGQGSTNHGNTVAILLGW